LALTITLVVTFESGPGNREQLFGVVEQRDAADARAECLAVRGKVCLYSLFPVPPFDQIPRGEQTIVFVENTLTQGRNRHHKLGRLLVDAANFQIFLDPHFREQRSEMLRPVFHRCALAVIPVSQELTKTNAGHVNPAAMAYDEVHRDVERVLGIIFEAGTVGESKRKQAGTATVGVRPHMTAHSEKTVEAAV